MNEQLSIKVISRGNTEKTIFTLDKGNAYSTKVAPNTIYQLIDNATKRGPDYVKVMRAGKDLRIKVFSDNEPSYELILEGYSDAEGVAVIGEMPDGVLYEYAGQISDVATQIAKLPADQELAVSLGQIPWYADESLIAQAAVPLLVASPATMAAILGGGGALVGAVSGGSASTYSNSDAEPAAKVWRLIELAANGTRDGAATPTLDQYRLIGVTGVDSAPKASPMSFTWCNIFSFSNWR